MAVWPACPCGQPLCHAFLGQAPRPPDWLRLPTRAEYLSAHPECAAGDTLNALCCACGSDKVLSHPQTGWFDHRFRHTCLSCGKVLFRTEEPR